MGQSEIKREHLRLTETDFPLLENKTKEIMSVILGELKSEPLQIDNWPFRYSFEKNNIEYELIFSQMGSVTLRLGQSDRYKRNPPPIFYISIGKYDRKGNNCKTTKSNNCAIVRTHRQGRGTESRRC